MNDRITYAQQKLLALVEARQLRSWSPLKKSPKWTNLQIPPESLEFEKW